MKLMMVETTHPTAEKVQAYYSWRASNYDRLTGFEVEHHAEAIRLADVRQGQRVLDAACGTGRASVALARAVGSTGQLDALDLTAAMLEQARAKIGQLGLGDHVHFELGNVKELPYPDETFDLVYNGAMFDLIPLDGFAPIVQEFKRVLKPGGKLVLVNMSKPHARTTLFEIIYAKGWAVAPCRPVLMSTFLESAGFLEIQRLYRANRARFLPLPFGTETVLARKPAAEMSRTASS